MSEAELHIITSRLQGAKRAAAERGELRFPLPVGYVHDDDGQTIIDPDEEVRAAIADLFCAFEQTGSAYGVVGVFKGRRFPKRAYGGAWAGELRWGALDAPAGAGRARRTRVTPGRMRSGATAPSAGSARTARSSTRSSSCPAREWAVLIQAHHPGYITWETYLANEQRLQANDTHSRSAPTARGPGAVSGDLPLRRVRSVDDDASPARGQLLRMRSLARGPHQHARLPVGQDRRRRRARRPPGARRDGPGGDRARARRRRSGR